MREPQERPDRHRRHLQGDQPRIAHGRARQLGRVLLPGPAGMAEVFDDADGARRAACASALGAASDGAYEAVHASGRGHHPHRRAGGREAAEACVAAAGSTRRNGSLSGSRRPLAQGHDALARTPDLLPVLEGGRCGRRRGRGFPAPARRGAARRPTVGRAGARSRSPAHDVHVAIAAFEADHGGATMSATCATRSCTSSRRPTKRSPRSRTSGPASATRSWSSVATGSGTATSTPTTSGPASRPRSTAAARARSGSPTCSSRSRRSGGCARAAGPLATEEPPRPQPVTAVVAVATGDGIRRIFHSLGVQRIVTGGQSMNPSTAQLLEGGRVGAGRRGRDPPEQQEHHRRGRAGAVADRQDRARRADPRSGRGFAPCWPTTPEAGRRQRGGDDRGGGRNVVAGEVTRAVRDSSSDAGPIREGDYLGISRDGIVAVNPRSTVRRSRCSSNS